MSGLVRRLLEGGRLLRRHSTDQLITHPLNVLVTVISGVLVAERWVNIDLADKRLIIEVTESFFLLGEVVSAFKHLLAVLLLGMQRRAGSHFTGFLL